MLVRRHHDQLAFARLAQPFLLPHEAEHNLLLGVVGVPLAGQPMVSSGPPLLLSAHDDRDTLAGVATYLQPFKLAVSRMPVAAAEAIGQYVATVDPAPPCVVGPPEVVAAVAAGWTQRTGRPTPPGLPQLIYALGQVVPPPPGPGRMRVATDDDYDLLYTWAVGFVRDTGVTHADPTEVVVRRLREREVVLWEVGGTPVSMAAAGSPTPNGVRIGFVYTPPEQRGRGHAARCVAALSQAQLDAGRRFCFLYTDAANPTSNRVYQRIGYEAVCAVDERLLPAN